MRIKAVWILIFMIRKQATVDEFLHENWKCRFSIPPRSSSTFRYTYAIQSVFHTFMEFYFISCLQDYQKYYGSGINLSINQIIKSRTLCLLTPEHEIIIRPAHKFYLYVLLLTYILRARVLDVVNGNNILERATFF